jgi:hypothetical protein
MSRRTCDIPASPFFSSNSSSGDIGAHPSTSSSSEMDGCSMSVLNSWQNGWQQALKKSAIKSAKGVASPSRQLRLTTRRR